MVKLKITMRKDGRQVTSFLDSKGRRVRTANGTVNWTQARDLMELALYAIQLQREQAAAGIGSDGSQMPPLKQPKTKFVARVSGRATFARKTVRDLYGPGKGGHMLDDIRVNYIDDRQVKYAITTRLSRIKANANETKAPWWGLSPASQQKLGLRMAEIFNVSVASTLVSLGLATASAVSSSANRLFRKAAA
jgi:hypothetical protein